MIDRKKKKTFSIVFAKSCDNYLVLLAHNYFYFVYL